jgi:PPOX class probable F420-dependent enzyme
MRTMSHDEHRAFLMERARTAQAATTRPDGRPHVTPVWYYLDGDDLIVTTHETSLNAIDLRRDPRICLCVDEESPPFDYVMIEGTVTLSDDLDALLRWATLIGGRYMGADRAEEYGKRNGVRGELLARVTPSKVIARADIAGYDIAGY